MRNPIQTKKVLIASWIALFMAMHFGCEDKLNEPYEGLVLTTDVDYTIGDNVILPLLGAYEAFYTRGWDELMTIGIRGDDVNAAGDQAPMQEQDNFLYQASHWNLNGIWTAEYSDIVRMFTAMEDIDKYAEAANDPDLVEQYKAECRTMRAWLYLQFGKAFGGGILIDQLDNIQAQPVSNKAEMMQYVIDEMEEVIPLLPAVHPRNRTDVPGGITRFTALAIQAQAYQEIEDYNGVAEATSQIISSGEFALAPDYYALFNSIASKLGEEFIMEFQRSDFGQAEGDKFNPNALWNPYGIGGWEPVTAGASAGWGFYEPTLKYIAFMLDRGETDRLETSVEFTPRGIDSLVAIHGTLPAWIDNTNREGDIFNDNGRLMFGSGKHIQPSTELTPGRTDAGDNKNCIGIRYAEILLMHAEALTRGASSSAMTALDAVNAVRVRANVPELTAVTTEDVLNEKYAEMAMEWGIRYYDMVRTRNTTELSHEGRTFTMDKAYYPFPADQVSELPQLADGVDN